MRSPNTTRAPRLPAACAAACILRPQSEARTVLRELLEHARAAPRHYRKAQREWLGRLNTNSPARCAQDQGPLAASTARCAARRRAAAA